MNVLEVEELTVEIAGKQVIENITMQIPVGQSNILFGPNGSGKTTFLMTLTGLPQYKITNGKIIFNGADITEKPIDERAQAGIGTGFQLPPEITGVKLKDLLKICEGKNHKGELSENAMQLVENLRLEKFLDRDVNLGFSGGERKRAEIAQLLLLKPKLLLLDEPDSGVDIESMKLITTEIQSYLDRENASALIITHQGYILDYINAKNACVMMDGGMYCRGDPKHIMNDIIKKGYAGCVSCRIKNPKE